MFYSACLACSDVPLWLNLDVSVIGMKKSLSVDIRGGAKGENPPSLIPHSQRGELIYISQTCSFLLRNGFSWSVGAGSLSADYRSGGTAQPSSQMTVPQQNKTYELNFISLSGLWYVESPRFISTLIPTPLLLLQPFDAWREFGS